MIRVLWILLFVASSVLWARDIDESASSSTEDVSSSSGPQELDVQISKSGFRTYRSEPQVTTKRVYAARFEWEYFWHFVVCCR